MIPTAITELAVPPTPILKQFKLNKSDITGIVIYSFPSKKGNYGI